MTYSRNDVNSRYVYGGKESFVRFIRDVLVIGIGVFLGFVAIVNSHDLIDVVYAFDQLQRLDLFAFIK